MTAEHQGAYSNLHSKRGSLPDGHPGRAMNPITKVEDLAWLEFEKPDVDHADLVADALIRMIAIDTCSSSRSSQN